MIIDSHAHVSEKTWASPKFLEEVIEPAVRASGAAIPATVYEGTDIPGMMEAYRAAGRQQGDAVRRRAPGAEVVRA